MKKSILTLLVFLVCVIQPTTAYDYFTIYFTDGTKSDRFYYADVDSICYSKIDIDGIEYEQWQTQEIWIKGNTYRYPLSLIDNISFTKVDIDRVANDIANVNNVITPLFIECNSVDELYNQIKALPDMENVEDVWIDGQRVMVRIMDCLPISFFYPISGEVYENQNLSSRSYPKSKTRSIDNSVDEHNPLTAKKACIINQQYYDEERKDRKEISEQLHDELELMGIDCKLNNKPLPNFFSNEMFEYDIVFIITHGGFYEGKHWLVTGDEYYCYNSDEARLDWNKSAKLLQTLKDHINNSNYKDCRLTWIKEVRDNQISAVFYLEISEDFISRDPSAHFNNRAIVFNAACESFENDNMWNLFEKKGAGCYLGYHDSNCLGQDAGKNFIEGLLTGKSTYASYRSLPNNMLEEHFYKYKGEKKWSDKDDPTRIKVGELNAILKMMPEKNSICIFHPHTEPAIDRSSDGKMEFLLKGNIKYFMPLGSIDMQTEYGFQWSLNSDMSQCKERETKTTQYKEMSMNMNWEMSLDGDDLQPNTTYYYRAYMYDGFSNCYGEIKSFTTKEYSQKEAYAILDGETLTYYYDERRLERWKGWEAGCIFNDYGYTPHYINKDNVKKIIFDSSFIYYTPTSLSLGRFRNLVEIKDIKYLNTRNMEDMAYMFSGCESLKELDLSSFDTKNVKYMQDMFDGCFSLSKLDLSGFKTSNVVDMNGMFDRCKSLTNLNLNSFDTHNVTSMSYMFRNCSSLSQINLSIFDTSNVVGMISMFEGCSSLNSIELSSFNTSKVTDIECMFKDCCLLTNINVNHFDTSNINDMSGLFCGCNALERIEVSNFITNNVENMNSMFAECSSLTKIDISNFSFENCQNLDFLFAGCTSLKEISMTPINNYFIHIWYIFEKCSSLKTIYTQKDWEVTLDSKMFEDCKNLQGGKGTVIGDNIYGYDTNGRPLYYYCGKSSDYARIDGGKDNPGLFTAK